MRIFRSPVAGVGDSGAGGHNVACPFFCLDILFKCMKKNLYIIPGYGHTAKTQEYVDIKKSACSKGYDVSFVSINWILPISKQIIKLKKTDTVFGFSLGAIIAHLSYKKTPCKKIILGSETPLYRITRRDILEATNENIIFADDLISIKNKMPQLKISSLFCIRLSGEHENLRGRKIKGAGHVLTKQYIQTICDFL